MDSFILRGRDKARELAMEPMIREWAEGGEAEQQEPQVAEQGAIRMSDKTDSG